MPYSPGVNPKHSAYLKSIFWATNWTFSSQLSNANQKIKQVKREQITSLACLCSSSLQRLSGEAGERLHFLQTDVLCAMAQFAMILLYCVLLVTRTHLVFVCPYASQKSSKTGTSTESQLRISIKVYINAHNNKQGMCFHSM